jgi:hypothetical protein
MKNCFKPLLRSEWLTARFRLWLRQALRLSGWRAITQCGFLCEQEAGKELIEVPRVLSTVTPGPFNDELANNSVPVILEIRRNIKTDDAGFAVE